MVRLLPGPRRDGGGDQRTRHGRRRRRELIRRWYFPDADADAIETLARDARLPRTIARLLLCRGISTAAEAQAFFAPCVDHLHDPYRMLGMALAVERLQAAVAARETILIYGDYDVDGTTATVLLKTALELLGGTVRYHIPHRVKEGYGMQTGVLRTAAEEGVRVVVSVDTGIRAFAVAEEARALGLDLIVTDHHLPDARGVPDAVAVLNPHQTGCSYPCKELCGAGVAFKLATALLLAWDEARTRTRLLPSFLKVAAIATIADAVPLTGENRVIVALGLRELERPVQPGLRALFRLSELDPSRAALTATDIAFRIAPRINAAGRMDIAGDVVELFTTRQTERAEALASKLHGLNAERRAVEKEIVDAITTELEEQATSAGEAGRAIPAMLVVAGEGWHRGVLGIAASRVVDRWSRPALVLSSEDGEAHGSGRSIRAYHLLDALTACADLFTRFGGHAHAAGFSLPSANIAALRERLQAHAAEALTPEQLIPELLCAAELPFARITPALLGWLSKMEPFGMGNPEPVFTTCNVEVAAPPRIMKEQHIRLRLGQPGNPQHWNGVGWRMAREVLDSGISQGSRLDIAYRLRRNKDAEYAGVELELADIRLALSPAAIGP